MRSQLFQGLRYFQSNDWLVFKKLIKCLINIGSMAYK